MSNKNTDFLKFNAYSIKDLITRKLTEDSNFTDQVYEGSNLAILIDIVSYMYQCFMFNLNNAASESMFSDTQMYENMNRLCKLIGYSPRGVIPSKLDVYIKQNDESSSLENVQIPKYAYIDTGLTDARGKTIYFSTNSSDTINAESYHKVQLYNGKWEMYGTVFTASGTDFETFELNGVKSDSENQEYVAGDFIDVYVESGGSLSKWYYDKYDIFHVSQNTNYQDDSNTINNPQFSKLYNENDKIYQIRMNENHQFEIKFGNGTSGKKLLEGDKIYVFYLNTNGEDGKIDPTQIEGNLKFQGSKEDFGISKALYNKIVFDIQNDADSDDLDVITDTEYSEKYDTLFDITVTKCKVNESVDEIRENAPECFKTGNRLITKNDYEYFYKNQITGGIIDVKCMNNWEYVSTFFAWLYKLGKDNHNNGEYYLNESYFTNYFGDRSKTFSDAADQNNIYLWIKYEDSNADVNNVIGDSSGINNIKTLTTETKYLKPIDVKFDICAAPLDVAKNYFSNGSTNFGLNVDNDTYDSYIEITLDENQVYINNSIETVVIRKIQEYFDVNNCKLGQKLDFVQLTNRIYEINGIKNIRTVYDPSVTENTLGGTSFQSRAYDGLSFASWSYGFIDMGDDLQITNTQTTLNNFQFPSLMNIENPEILMKKIKVIKKQLNNTNYIKF